MKKKSAVERVSDVGKAIGDKLAQPKKKKVRGRRRGVGIYTLEKMVEEGQQIIHMKLKKRK